MFKNILFIMGTTCSGKSTLARRLANRGWVTFHTGDLFRNMNGKVFEGENPDAPASFEDVVEKSFTQFIDAVEKQTALSGSPVVQVAVETMPKSKRQVDYIVKLVECGWCVTVIALDADQSIRTSRAQSRAMVQNRDLTNDIARITTGADVANVDNMSGLLLTRGIMVTSSSTDEWDHSFLPESSPSGIELMMTAVANLYNTKTAYSSSTLPCERMAIRAREEVDEYLEAISRDRPHMYRVEELIDALAFLLGAFSAESVTPDLLFRKFIQKYDINQLRHGSDQKPHLEQ